MRHKSLHAVFSPIRLQIQLYSHRCGIDQRQDYARPWGRHIEALSPGLVLVRGRPDLTIRAW